MKLAKKYYVFAIGLTVFSVLLALANTSQPVILEQLIDHLGNTNQSVSFWVCMYFFSIIVILAVELCRKLLEARYSASLKDWLRTEITHGILCRSPRKFAELAPQEYISILNNDILAVVDEYYLKIVNIIFQVLSIIFSCTVLTQIYFPLAVISAGTSLLIAGIPFLFKTQLQSRREQSLNSIGKFNVKFSDVVFGYSEIRIQQIRKAIDRIISITSKETAEKEFSFEKVQAWSEILIGFVSFMGTFLIIALGGYQVHQGNLDIGSLFAAIQLSDQLVMPIIGISTSLNAVVASNKVKRNLFGYGTVSNNLPPETAAEKANQEATETKLENISIENLTLKFSDSYIFQNYSQRFEKNKKYLIIGQNGSGKSTLVRLIAKDLTAKAAEIGGTIQMNGVTQNECSDEELFRKLTIVSQVPYIFSGTVKENLTLFDELDMENLKEFSVLADEGILKLLHDDRNISNESTHISNGEREKISLIRALMKHPDWIILDEATAALDKESKKAFEEYILGRKDLTVIHISHSYHDADIEKYDEVIRLGE